MQGSGIWSPPTGTLGRIVHETEARVDALRRTAGRIEDAARAAKPPKHSLADALRRRASKPSCFSETFVPRALRGCRMRLAPIFRIAYLIGLKGFS